MQQPSTNPPIPIRFRRHLFDEMAYAIGEALRHYPNTVKFSASPLSPTTYMRRFREAITAKVRYGYLSSYIEEYLFSKYQRDLAIGEYGEDSVIIGPSSALRNHHKEIRGKLLETKFNPTTPPQPLIEVPMSQLRNFALLLPYLKPRPTNFFVLPLSSPQSQAILMDYESQYDIGFVPDETNTNRYLII